MTARKSIVVDDDRPAQEGTPTERPRPYAAGRPVIRDLAFLAAAVVLAALAILPGRTGDGSSIAQMQLVGNIAAVMIAVIGLNLLTGYAGLPSLGQGAFFAIGAYGGAWLTVSAGLPAWMAIIAAVALSALLGAVVAVATMRMRGPQVAMITLVLAIVVSRLLGETVQLGQLSGYPNPVQHGTGLLEPLQIFGVLLQPPLFGGTPATVLVPIMGLLVAVVVLYRNLVRSPWGRSLRAIRESDLVAAHLGVNVFARKTAVFTLAAGLAGLGGVFFTQVFGHLQPESFTYFLGINMIVMVIFGGSGTVLGPVVGAAVLMWLQSSSLMNTLVDVQKDHLSDRWFLSGQGLIGLIFIATLFLLPRGVCGTLGRLPLRRTAAPPVAPRRAPSAAPPAAPPADTPPTGSLDGEPLLEVRDLGKSFGGLTAVSEMSLTVRSGSVHGLIGPNGAGKSTFANVITGVYRPDTGSLRFAGADITGLRPHQASRAGIARTFQTPQLFLDDTALENVMAGFADTGRLPLWRAALKPPSQYRREAQLEAVAMELLDRVGLAEDAAKRAGELAYGRQRALEVARALAASPRLLILDEPAAGLNPTETETLGGLLASLRDQGLALLLVEHHMDLITSVSDEVTCMNNGRLLARGRPHDVLTHPDVVTAYLGVTTTTPESDS